MLVHFFAVRQQSDSSPIDHLHAAFGLSIPRYTLLEGGEYVHYLFCIQMDKQEIRDICENHRYILSGAEIRREFTTVDVDPNMYNTAHRAGISYTPPAGYVLVPIDT